MRSHIIYKEDAQEILRNLQKKLEELFDINVRKHFLAPLQMIRVKKRLDTTKKGTNKKIESMIMASQNDTYGNMLIEGMDIVKQEQTNDNKEAAKKKETKEEDSEDTISNTSTISNSTTKTIQFSKSAEEGNELTATSCIQSMREQTARYNITYEESMEHIEEFHADNEVLMASEDMDDIHDNIGLGAWKELKTGIHAKRKLMEIKR